MDFKKLENEYYLGDTLSIAKDLIGKYLVIKKEDSVIALRILETEAYIGKTDKACHAYNGKSTERTKTLYMKGGTSYIYFIYGMYYCMNVVTEKEGEAAAVLIRGGEVVKGIEEASLLRYGKEFSELTNYQVKNFSNGPGKLCKAMGINKSLNQTSLLSDNFFIASHIAGIENKSYDIQLGKRINIDYAEEARDFLWRFFV